MISKKVVLSLVFSAPFIFFFVLCIAVIMTISRENSVGDDFIGGGDGEYETVGIAPEVERFRAVFEKYARQEGVFDQVNIIMALTMQESGGRSLDIMQSSESIGLPPNSITDPERSIEVGIKHFKKVFKQAGGDVRLTLQAYNFGSGFIDYVKKNGGEYTKKLALDFSRLQAFKMGWKSYGDPSYVDHVMRYVKGSDKNVKPVNGSMDFYETVMKEALKYEGQPYAWGGSNPKTGFDCSGLVQWSFAKAGITLPRTAQEQHGATKKISEKEVTAGDLVFFGGTYEGKAITHVGIYVGNGRMFNSNDSGIEYSDLKSGYWRDHLVSFGRIK
ncbi:endopeptidase [Bacillus halotolerans]|uniref:bifunctional lytic transglycosylase/C40 family peptidase n=1 Tax=Bacillus subtilis group TaxID=653685 RepID=UPI000A110B67|nr:MULTISPECIES: bifunctional lytic transglycosylase/C40 family peptidase [Bacillus subtilis group]QJC87427.1 Response regulator aspartate phosphatase I [Bacillus subtilis]AZV48868.1 endopeptidase [Bacillus halotolerans]WEZ00962.1 bifunctional lytic transglycosylase/C40 family peptidase [Bacillus subtilis]WGE04411.1 bifunctional lytic transglycosylase/C40 family peptidase [Bacillus subtilis]WNW25813.1 bifunctional lytic transglycosylase/C40 family peptidase [Bacillus inaquosorum]